LYVAESLGVNDPEKLTLHRLETEIRNHHDIDEIWYKNQVERLEKIELTRAEVTEKERKRLERTELAKIEAAQKEKEIELAKIEAEVKTKVTEFASVARIQSQESNVNVDTNQTCEYRQILLKQMNKFDPEKEDIYLYIKRFEQIANADKLDKTKWAHFLICLMPTIVSEYVTCEISVGSSTDYEETKKLLIDKFQITPEKLWQQFFEVKKRLGGDLDRCSIRIVY